MAGNLVLVSSTETHGKSAFGKVRHYSEFRRIGRGSSVWVSLLPIYHTFNCYNKVLTLNFAHVSYSIHFPYCLKQNSNCRFRGREFDPGPVPYFRGD